MATAKAAKTTKHTHSVWSGRRYPQPQTVEDLTSEGLAVVRGHAAIARTLRNADRWLEEYRRQALGGKEN